MLGKLLKYELKATARLLIPLYLILLSISIVNRIVLHWEVYEGLARFVHASFQFMYIVFAIFTIVITLIYMISRFYKNLITDEGYLMFTLPVTTHSLILSKIMITLFWTVISIFAILGSLYIAFATPDIMTTLNHEINSLVEAEGLFLILGFLMAGVVGLLSNILLVYVSIAIGQLFSGQKIIGSLISYIAIYTGIQLFAIFILVLATRLSFSNLSTINIQPEEILPYIVCATIVECIVFYMTTHHIFKNKLNLE